MIFHHLNLPLKHIHEPEGQVMVSALLPYSALILTVVCVLLFAARYYAFEPLAKRFYQKTYEQLDERQRRSFINHHIAAMTKIVVFILAVYPVASVVTVHRTLHEPFAKSDHVTMGDILIIVYQLFTAMYIFELFYRSQVTLISTAHHIGAIVIAQSATVLCLDPKHKDDADLEFILCLIWGFFDIFAEFWPHLTMIIYRLCNTRHVLLSKILLITALIEVVSTTIETVVVMAIFGDLWNRWTLVFKVITPILHVLFSAAQLIGARIFYKMYLDERKKALAEKNARSPDLAVSMVA